MLTLKTNASGRVVNKTFSKRVNGNPLPTKEAVYIMTEAFELDQSTDPYKEFSEKARNFIANKYGVSPNLMIFDTPAIGMRLNGEEDQCNRIARDLGFAAYQACK